MLQVPTICSLDYAGCALRGAHPNYLRLLHLACECHSGGRNPDAVGAGDVALARLYCYAFRRQVIGAFHATRVRLEALPEPEGAAGLCRLRSRELLADLANMAIDAVPSDFRALLGPFYRYEYQIGRAVAEMREEARLSGRDEVVRVADRFVEIVSGVRSCNGIELTRDDEAPEQASFVVPNLGITIVPLVYGDHHSWNLAWLDPGRSDVPHHRHFHGVEIHLGYGPMRGHVVLGESRALLGEGYALAVPPNTRHGYVNASGMAHHLPFIFGSYKRAGWGVFFDVDPQPMSLEELRETDPASEKLNGLVLIERQIEAMKRLPMGLRKRILPGWRTDRDGTGGLELHLSAPAKGKPFAIAAGRFLAASVVSGAGVLRMAGQERAISRHDHFAIPAGIAAEIEQVGEERLVVMDADLVPPGSGRA